MTANLTSFYLYLIISRLHDNSSDFIRHRRFGLQDSFHPSINRPYAHTQPGTLFTFDLHFMPRYVLDSTYGTTLHIPDLELMCFWISFNFIMMTSFLCCLEKPLNYIDKTQFNSFFFLITYTQIHVC